MACALASGTSLALTCGKSNSFRQAVINRRMPPLGEP